MRLVWALFAMLLLVGVPYRAHATDTAAPADGTRFVAVAFHDVVDRREDRADDAVTTQSLVDFFDWLKADGWTPVSMDAVEAAGRGGPPLPPKAILLSFDDGYASFHDRVYPLLLAYGYPAVLALTTSWLDVPAGGQVNYGGNPVPRSHFLSWDQVRRIAASGLVTIASHSHDLHRTLPSTPQGNSAPADRVWAFDPATGRYETDVQHVARIRADLERSRARIAAETGVAPHVLVWPFGRFSGPAVDAARAAGFSQAFTLEPEPADARHPMALHRYYPTQDPSLGVLAWNLAFRQPRAETVRMVCLDMAPLAGLGAAEQDAMLGEMVETVRRLGPTDVVLDLVPPGAPATAAWLPTPVLPLQADIIGRVARQLSTRAGVRIVARLPGEDSGLSDDARRRLASDAARFAMLDGLLVPGGAGAAAAPAAAPAPADLRAARAASDARAVALARDAIAIEPSLRLLTIGPDGPDDTANRRVVMGAGQNGDQGAALAAGGWLTPAHSGRAVMVLPAGDAAAQARAMQAAQKEGATAFLACPFDAAAARALAPAFSAATFPWLP